MDFLGIGPLELIFVFIIVLIVLGPNDMVKAGATLGRYLRQIMKSDTWRVIQDTSREIRGLPNKLARQAGLEELEKELREGMDFPSIGDIPKQIEEGLKRNCNLIPGSIRPMKCRPKRKPRRTQRPRNKAPPQKIIRKNRTQSLRTRMVSLINSPMPQPLLTKPENLQQNDTVRWEFRTYPPPFVNQFVEFAAHTVLMPMRLVCETSFAKS